MWQNLIFKIDAVYLVFFQYPLHNPASNSRRSSSSSIRRGVLSANGTGFAETGVGVVPTYICTRPTYACTQPNTVRTYLLLPTYRCTTSTHPTYVLYVLPSYVFVPYRPPPPHFISSYVLPYKFKTAASAATLPLPLPCAAACL